MNQTPSHNMLNIDSRLIALRDAFLQLTDRQGTKVEKFRDAFVQTIEHGLWRPGDPVPSEKVLLAVLPLSQGTLQSAMRRLTEEGIINRKRGAGSRISSSNEHGKTPWYMRFRIEGEANLMPIEIETAEISETHETGIWSAALGARPSYIKIVRTLIVNSTFPIYVVAYLDAGRFRPMLDFSDDIVVFHYLRFLLHDRFNMPTFRARETALFRRATPEVAKVIGVDTDTSILTLQTVNLSLNDEPVVYQEFHIPPNDLLLDLSHRYRG